VSPPVSPPVSPLVSPPNCRFKRGREPFGSAPTRELCVTAEAEDTGMSEEAPFERMLRMTERTVVPSFTTAERGSPELESEPVRGTGTGRDPPTPPRALVAVPRAPEAAPAPPARPPTAATGLDGTTHKQSQQLLDIKSIA
jgi:hypothetical protein